MRRLVVLLVAQLSIFAQGRLLAIDQDGDGMSDVWQQKYSVPSADATKDYNSTGLTNIQKSLLGLDPRAPNVVFQVQQIPDPAHNELRLRISTAVGKNYQMESSTDLKNWSPVGSVVLGNGGQADVVTTMPSSTVFFRARFASDIDGDNDGLTAWEENDLGTSDNNSDTDGDLRSDANEFQNGTDPLDYYNGGIPLPVYRFHTRAAAKQKQGFLSLSLLARYGFSCSRSTQPRLTAAIPKARSAESSPQLWIILTLATPPKTEPEVPLILAMPPGVSACPMRTTMRPGLESNTHRMPPTATAPLAVTTIRPTK